MLVTLSLAALDGHSPQQLTLPTSWADVTLAQYLAAHTADSPYPVALRLSGLPDAVLHELPIIEAEGLAQHLAAALDETVLEALLPTPGLLEIGRSAWGLFQQAQQYLAAEPDAHPLAHGATLYALYRAPTGFRADAQQLAAAHAQVLARPVPEVYADCLHFLASYQRAATGTSLPGPAQPGVRRIERPAAPTPPGWRARLDNSWNAATRLLA